MNAHLRSSFETPAKLLIDPLASRWLQNAALHLGTSMADAQEFGFTGLLRLPGLSIQLQLWRETPQPQWLALGVLYRPNDVSPLLWNELILRGNCAITAVSGGTGAIDERGDGLLVNRLGIQSYSDNTQLGESLGVLIALAESLIAGATSLSNMPAQLGTVAQQPFIPVTPASSIATMVHSWHRTLLVGALQHLGNITSPTSIDTVGVVRIGNQSLEVIADSDERHLLVSTSIKRPLHSGHQRTLALRANLELMTLTGCSVALAPFGPCLQGRWDSEGLDGIALGDWLGDFAQLAAAIGVPSAPPAPGCSR